MANVSVWVETLKRGTFRAKWREMVTGADGVARLKKRPGPVFHNRKEVEDWAELKRHQLEARGEVPETGHIPLLQLVDRWVAYQVSADHMRQENADAQAGNVRRILKQLGWTTTVDARVADVMKWRTDHDNVGERNLACVRSLLNWAKTKLDQNVDNRVLTELTPAASDETSWDPMSPMQYQAILKEAASKGHLALFVGLGTFGWRPITAARLQVKHVLLNRANGPELQIGVKVKRKKPRLLLHPIPSWYLDLLLPLIKDRGPEEAVFLQKRAGKLVPWDSSVSAKGMSTWYFNHLRPFAPESGRIYALKRFAVTAMLEGAPPWGRPLTIDEVMAYTGWTNLATAQRYIRPFMARVKSAFAPTLPPALEVALKSVPSPASGGNMGAESEIG